MVCAAKSPFSWYSDAPHGLEIKSWQRQCCLWPPASWGSISCRLPQGLGSPGFTAQQWHLWLTVVLHWAVGGVLSSGPMAAQLGGLQWNEAVACGWMDTPADVITLSKCICGNVFVLLDWMYPLVFKVCVCVFCYSAASCWGLLCRVLTPQSSSHVFCRWVETK